MPRSYKKCLIAVSLLVICACRALSTPQPIESTPGSTPGVITPAANQSPEVSTQPPPAVLPTQSSAAPTASPTISPDPTMPTVPTQPPTASAQVVQDIGPFHGIASLAGILMDSPGSVQVHPLDDGIVWVTSDRQALRWDGLEWQSVLPESEPFLAAVDEPGRLWVQQMGKDEISAWQDGQWATYSEDQGMMYAGYFEKSWWSPTPWRASMDAHGTLWLPMAGGVSSFDGVKWMTHGMDEMGFPMPPGGEMIVDHNLAMAGGGTEVWVGECYYAGPGPMGGGGVRWYDGQSWQGEASPAGSGCVSAMTVDSTGNVWLGISTNIWEHDQATGAWTQYPLPVELLGDFNFTHPRQLVIDGSGDAWVGMQMCGGASCDVLARLYRIHQGEWSLVRESAYWEASNKQLVLDGEGQAWSFWDGVIYQLGDHPVEVAQVEPLGVGASPEGRIWMVAGSGDSLSLLVMGP